MYKHIILSRLLDYLKLKKIPIRKSGKVIMVKCPFCKKEPFSATIVYPITDRINCLNCNKTYNLIDMAKQLEGLKPDISEEECLQHLKNILNIKVMTKKDENDVYEFLKNYQRWGFDLVPIITNGKIPIEKDWTKKNHKDIEEWHKWIKDGLNIGVKTGQISGITIIDIDQKPIPPEIDTIKGDCLVQESTKGYHLIYKYEPDLRKTRIDELKIDIENDGGQVVIYPSTIKGVRRTFIDIKEELTKIPEELKTLLLKKMTVPRQTYSEKLSEDIKTEEFNLGVLGEGQRNSSFIRLGGIFRKELNLKETTFVLKTLNKHLCKDPLPDREIYAMMRSIDKYSTFDEKELAHKVLEYLKYVEEANRTEIAMAVVGSNRGEEKKRVDLSLTYLVKEGYILKRGRSYSIFKKADWKEILIATGKPVDFQVPYFYDVANFNWGDLLLIGSKNKKGKTHISMNIVKQLVEQGIKPYYISLETGSRFAKIALQLGLKEGDFKWTFCSDPTQIELEPDAVTIIDWLLIIDKSKTDLVFRHFVEQLYKTNGVLIVFQQLKQDNSYFAPNMAMQFPALSARYIYDNEDVGEYGHFKVDVIREPKIRIKSYEIPCQYNWETKKLNKVEADKDEKTKEKKVK